MITQTLRILPIAICAAIIGTAAHAEDAQALFKRSACVACHSVETKLLGPALKDVAAKHAGQADAAATLAKHIKLGSQGVWGPVPMPPNAVSDEQAQALAEWVLTLK